MSNNRTLWLIMGVISTSIMILPRMPDASAQDRFQITYPTAGTNVPPGENNQGRTTVTGKGAPLGCTQPGCAIVVSVTTTERFIQDCILIINADGTWSCDGVFFSGKGAWQ